MNYYNEFDPAAAAWLRELIAQGEIPDGHVDERSILDVRPHELYGYTQHHFFAGLGGWPLALRLAGWPDSRPVRTGSCPCQPFSVAGKGQGEADARHLWPNFRDLIKFGIPAVTFGEQVASADGRAWLSGVRVDLEGLGYEVGAADLCAAGIGAPHIRQRIYWVANPPGKQRHRSGDARGGRGKPANSGDPGGVAHGIGAGLEGHPGDGHQGDQPGRIGTGAAGPTPEGGPACGVGNAESQRKGSIPGGSREGLLQPPGNGGMEFWTASRWIECRDGKLRRVPTEPGLFPLADGLPYRLARRGSVRAPLLKGAGNAIVPELAATFIRAFLTA